MQINYVDGQGSLFAQDMESGKTCRVRSPADRQKDQTSRKSSMRSSKLKIRTFMLLNLNPGAGNLLGAYWEYDPPWLGPPGTLNTSASPRDALDCSLSQILHDTVPSRYYLSKKACLGILRRAEERGKPLPKQLDTALRIQAGLCKQTATEQPTVASFHAGAGPSAGTIGYHEELAPTLKGSASGNMAPSVLCINDQGGKRMDCSEELSGTLRAAEHGHQPLVYANHGIDGRYTGPLSTAFTITARYGTGGGNCPLVDQPKTYCITGNAIDRQPQNGGNGMGWQVNLAYTLTATNHHAVFSRQLVDKFCENDVVSTESARQHKDVTDLICQPSVLAMLIRRLTPMERERLQGFPDNWTNLPRAADSNRYKALGNSVAIPCVDCLLFGVAYVLSHEVDDPYWELLIA